VCGARVRDGISTVPDAILESRDMKLTTEQAVEQATKELAEPGICLASSYVQARAMFLLAVNEMAVVDEDTQCAARFEKLVNEVMDAA